MSIRVLIADDHSFVRMGISAFLSTEKGIEVVGEAKNGDEAIQEVLRLNPDVAIVDLMMPKKDGVAATAEIVRLNSRTKVILLTAYGSADGIAHALEAGAAGVLMKNTANTAFVAAIRKVASGGQAISPEIKRQLESTPPIPKLSPKQASVLESMTRGLTNRDIACMLGISEDRVEEHVNAIFQKLGAANRAEAVGIALRKHLLKI